MKYVAYYQPALNPGQKDPTRRGFSTRREAEQYIEGLVCEDCKDDARRKRFGFRTVMDTGCAAEWLIVPQSEFEKAKTQVDILKAAGYTLIKNRYEKESRKKTKRNKTTKGKNKKRSTRGTKSRR